MVHHLAAAPLQLWPPQHPRARAHHPTQCQLQL